MHRFKLLKSPSRKDEGESSHKPVFSPPKIPSKFFAVKISDELEKLSISKKVGQDRVALTPPNQFGVRMRTAHRVCNGKCPENECKCWNETPVGPALKPHQIPAINWMIERESCDHYGIKGGLNSMEMGLGKTLASLTVVMRDYGSDSPPEFPTLIACPLSAIYTWKEQIDTFFGDTCPYLIARTDVIGKTRMAKLTTEEFKKYKIVICNYETLRNISSEYGVYEHLFEYDQFDRRVGINSRDKPTPGEMAQQGEIALFNTPWHRIIADEGHTFNNPKSAIFYTMMSIWARHKWCLTGTPLRNRTSDLFSQFRFLGFNKVIMPQEFTITLYTNCSLDKCVLYMTKEDAMIKLPEKKIIEVPVELGEREKEMYDYFRCKTREAYNDHLVAGAAFVNVLTMFLRLRQCCLAPNIIVEKEKEKGSSGASTADKEALDRMTDGLHSWVSDKEGTAGVGSAKVVKCINLIVNEVPAGKKVIVFASFKTLINLLAYALRKRSPEIGYELVDGNIKGQQRDEALDRFKKDKSKKVLFISLKVGSESLNLTEASYIIQMESTWTPAVLDQANARSHRVGQEEDVTIWKIIAQHTIEQKMEQICENKRRLFEQFITNKSRKGGSSGLDAKTIGAIIR